MSSTPTWQRIKEQQQLLDQYLWRERVLEGIRVFFKQQHFHEVETPLLVQSPGTEPYLDVFETRLKVADGRELPAYLLTSPEYAMKKLLTAGLSPIFQIAKSFRNGEGIGEMHNHEFTLLEWYRADVDYQQIMDDCEDLILHLVEETNKTKEEFEYQGKMFDLTQPWPKKSVAELFEQYVGVTVNLLVSDKLMTNAREKGFSVDSWDEAFHLLFLNLIEPELAQMDRPVFVYDYPIQQAALARRKADDPRFAERFELYFAGVELANAFTELTDPVEQKERLEHELKLRQDRGKTVYPLDQDFIRALDAGMPASGGIALGVDRLIMLFANVSSIKEVLFFPIEEVFNLK